MYILHQLEERVAIIATTNDNDILREQWQKFVQECQLEPQAGIISHRPHEEPNPYTEIVEAMYGMYLLVGAEVKLDTIQETAKSMIAMTLIADLRERGA